MQSFDELLLLAGLSLSWHHKISPRRALSFSDHIVIRFLEGLLVFLGSLPPVALGDVFGDLLGVVHLLESRWRSTHSSLLQPPFFILGEFFSSRAWRRICGSLGRASWPHNSTRLSSEGVCCGIRLNSDSESSPHGAPATLIIRSGVVWIDVALHSVMLGALRPFQIRRCLDRSRRMIVQQYVGHHRGGCLGALLPCSISLESVCGNGECLLVDGVVVH
jgi:hypothetical protein